MNQNQIKSKILNTLNGIVGNDRIVEVRILNTKKGTVSGYYDDCPKLIKDVLPCMGKYDVYLTINPPKPALLTRASNHLKCWAKKLLRMRI